MGAHNHPEVSMHTFPFKWHVDRMERDEWQEVAELMLSSAAKLARIGADFAICPDNTAHQAMPMVRPRSAIPWLHIAEEVTREAGRLGYRKIGLTGTRSLVASSVYPDALAAADIQAVRPTVDQQRQLDAIIFDELVWKVPAEIILLSAGCDELSQGCWVRCGSPRLYRTSDPCGGPVDTAANAGFHAHPRPGCSSQGRGRTADSVRLMIAALANSLIRGFAFATAFQA
jgi:hypothetical protein